MPDVEFADQFAHQIGEIVAMVNKWHQLPILLTNRFPIEPVHVRRVEEVAHVAPGFVVDLGPLRVPIDHRIERTDFDPVILRIDLVLWQIDHGVILIDLDQHLLAVVRDLVVVYVAEDGLLAFFNVVNAKRQLPRIPTATSLIVALVFLRTEVEDLAFDDADIAIVTSRNLDADNAIVQAIKIDTGWLRSWSRRG